MVQHDYLGVQPIFFAVGVPLLRPSVDSPRLARMLLTNCSAGDPIVTPLACPPRLGRFSLPRVLALASPVLPCTNLMKPFYTLWADAYLRRVRLCYGRCGPEGGHPPDCLELGLFLLRQDCFLPLRPLLRTPLVGLFPCLFGDALWCAP